MMFRVRYYFKKLGLECRHLNNEELWKKLEQSLNIQKQWIENTGASKRAIAGFLETQHIEWRSAFFDLPVRRK